MLRHIISATISLSTVVAAVALFWSLLTGPALQPRPSTSFRWLPTYIELPDPLLVPSDKKPRLAIIEFSDYECRFCARHATNILPQLRRQFIEPGTVGYVFRHFPLDAIHPNARVAAKASNCASAQGRFWDMHDVLFRRRLSVGTVAMVDYSQLVDLNRSAFQACMAKTPDPTIEADIRQARTLGVTQTPTFVFVVRSEGGLAHAVASVLGAQPLSVFEEAIRTVSSRLSR
jgi:protein-disulfide isomerase